MLEVSTLKCSLSNASISVLVSSSQHVSDLVILQSSLNHRTMDGPAAAAARPISNNKSQVLHVVYRVLIWYSVLLSWVWIPQH